MRPENAVCLVLTVMMLPAFSPLQAEQKLGYIDSQVLWEALPEFKDVRRKLERLKNEYEQEAIEQQSKLKRMEEEFRKQELLMSEAHKAEMKALYEEAYTKAQEFSLQKLGPTGELSRKNNELSAPIFEKINAALAALAKEEGYGFIFDVAVGGAIVFADPERHNLTDKLLARLEELKEEQEQQK